MANFIANGGEANFLVVRLAAISIANGGDAASYAAALAMDVGWM